MTISKRNRYFSHPSKGSAVGTVEADPIWALVRNYLVDTKGINGQRVDTLHRAGIIASETYESEPAIAFAYRDPSGQHHGRELLCLKSGKRELPAMETASFRIGNLNTAGTVVAVESPLEALSFHCLKGNDQTAIVSCLGSQVSPDLMLGCYLRKQSFVVAFEKTASGEAAWSRAWDETADWGGFLLTSDCPKNRNWNADLTELRERRQGRSVRI